MADVVCLLIGKREKERGEREKRYKQRSNTIYETRILLWKKAENVNKTIIITLLFKQK